VSLEHVRRFDVSEEIVRTTEKALQLAGADGYELFVVWSGVLAGEVFTVVTPHVPHQASYKTHEGLLVRVEGEALHALNAWLHENSEQLAVQVHAHPNDAYHSSTDDTFPIVTELGGLSVVAPRFGRDGLFVEGTAVYRLSDRGWLGVPDEAPAEIRVTS
jgi:hypothetical protein